MKCPKKPTTSAFQAARRRLDAPGGLGDPHRGQQPAYAKAPAPWTGPIYPLSDPVEHEKLRAMLSQDLTPIDVHLEPHTDAMIRYTLDLPRHDLFYAIVGISSTMLPDAAWIDRIEIDDAVVLQSFDPAIYNVGHLVPTELGVCSRKILPIIKGRSSRPICLTFWCVTRGAMASSVDRAVYEADIAKAKRGTDTRFLFVEGGAPSPVLLKALRAIKEDGINVDDDDLRAALDRYAPLL